MYCKNCGKKNPEKSKFCQYCGIDLSSSGSGNEVNKSVEHKGRDSTDIIDTNTPPYPYVISISKLLILSVTTFGLYEIYWFYKHFKSFKEEGDWKITPWARALFAALMSYSLFKHVSDKVKKIDKNRGLAAGVLAITFFILNTLWSLPDPYWWFSILTVLPLIPVQNTINFYWEEKYGNKLERSNFGTGNLIWAVIGGIILVLALYGTFDTGSEYTDQSTNTINNTSTDTTDNTASLEATYGKNFIESCNEDGSMYGTCSCLLEYLRANYSFSERLKMDEEYTKTEQLPQAMYDAIDACANQ